MTAGRATSSTARRVVASGAAFDLGGDGPLGAVLIHGFTSTPWEVRHLGLRLAEAGLTAHGPVLPGHGTSIDDLARTRWEDWVGAVDRAVDAVRTRCDRVAVVGQSPTVARHWTTPLSFCFIDGGHGEMPARLDYEGWTPHIAMGGILAIHDVFPDPADGGRPPYEQIFLPALQSGRFRLESATGSLRILRRVD